MPGPIEQIVENYVRQKKLGALADLMMHRQRLIADLKGRSGYDLSLPISQVEHEMAVIERGFARLDTAAAA